MFIKIVSKNPFMKLDEKLMEAYRTDSDEFKKMLFTAKNQSIWERQEMKREIKRFSIPLSVKYCSKLDSLLAGSLIATTILYLSLKKSPGFSDIENLSATYGGKVLALSCGIVLASMFSSSLLKWVDAFRKPYTHSKGYELINADAGRNAQKKIVE